MRENEEGLEVDTGSVLMIGVVGADSGDNFGDRLLEFEREAERVDIRAKKGKVKWIE